MKLNIQIEDSLYELYEKTFGSPKLYARMKAAIEAFSRIPENDRVLMLYGDTRRAIEAVFGTTLDTPEKLLSLIKDMNRVKINGVEVNFTEDELDRIAMQAKFHGRSTETFIKEMIQEISGRMLERV